MIIPESFKPFSFVNCGFCNAKESLSLADPILMSQVHSADVLILQNIPPMAPECDAMVTQVSHLKLTVKTADCAPLLFLDPKSKVVGAVHAGWKGAFQGIIENTVLTLLKKGAHLHDIMVAIGPHLTQQSFQISSEMQALFPKTEFCFFKHTPNGIYFDFTSYLVHRLKRVGIEHIETYPIDTFTNVAYNSYRRDSKNSARQYSFIELK